MSSMVYLWLHLLGFGTYSGATLALLVIVIPLLRAETAGARQWRLTAATMRVCDPLTIGALGVAVIVWLALRMAHSFTGPA